MGIIKGSVRTMGGGGGGGFVINWPYGSRSRSVIELRIRFRIKDSKKTVKYKKISALLPAYFDKIF